MNQADDLNKLMEICYSCTSCPALVRSRQTEKWGKPVYGHGIPGAPYMFIGEAPGRLGAARTGIPFKGDKSGDFLEWCFEEIGVQPDSIYITNMVKCLPKDEKGNNRKPSKLEVDQCMTHLVAEVSAVNPKVLICLGKTAYKAITEKSQWYPSLRTRDTVVVYHPSYIYNYKGGKPGTARAEKYVSSLAKAMSINPVKLSKAEIIKNAIEKVRNDPEIQRRIAELSKELSTLTHEDLHKRIGEISINCADLRRDE